MKKLQPNFRMYFIFRRVVLDFSLLICPQKALISIWITFWWQAIAQKLPLNLGKCSTALAGTVCGGRRSQHMCFVR